VSDDNMTDRGQPVAWAIWHESEEAPGRIAYANPMRFLRGTGETRDGEEFIPLYGYSYGESNNKRENTTMSRDATPGAGSVRCAGTLTDEERAALKWGINWLFARFSMDDNPAAHRDIKTLRELFACVSVTNPMPIEISAEVSSHPKSDRIYVSDQDPSD